MPPAQKAKSNKKDKKDKKNKKALTQKQLNRGLRPSSLLLKRHMKSMLAEIHKSGEYPSVFTRTATKIIQNLVVGYIFDLGNQMKKIRDGGRREDFNTIFQRITPAHIVNATPRYYNMRLEKYDLKPALKIESTMHLIRLGGMDKTFKDANFINGNPLNPMELRSKYPDKKELTSKLATFPTKSTLYRIYTNTSAINKRTIPHWLFNNFTIILNEIVFKILTLAKPKLTRHKTGQVYLYDDTIIQNAIQQRPFLSRLASDASVAVPAPKPLVEDKRARSKKLTDAQKIIKALKLGKQLKSSTRLNRLVLEIIKQSSTATQFLDANNVKTRISNAAVNELIKIFRPREKELPSDGNIKIQAHGLYNAALPEWSKLKISKLSTD